MEEIWKWELLQKKRPELANQLLHGVNKILGEKKPALAAKELLRVNEVLREELKKNEKGIGASKIGIGWN